MRYFKNIITTLELFGEATGCIESIIIFGSRATGLNEFDSDIDIAIEIGSPGEENSKDAAWHFHHEEWKQELQKYIPYKISINRYREESKTELMQNIRKHGVIAYKIKHI